MANGPASKGSTEKKSSQKSSRAYSQRTLGLLWGLSGNKCAHPECDHELIAAETTHDKSQIIGHIAHIYGSSDDGPRAKPDMLPKERDDYQNLILLCRHHHGLIDAQDNSFTAEQLLEWKRKHEHIQREAQRKQARVSIASVSFPELEAAATGLLGVRIQGAGKYSAVPPDQKMQINELGSESRFSLTLGASKSPEVERFITVQNQLDAEFGERLKAGFIQIYTKLRSDGLRGDELFDEMLIFSHGGTEKESRKSAGLAILAHLFIICDIFEVIPDGEPLAADEIHV